MKRLHVIAFSMGVVAFVGVNPSLAQDARTPQRGAETEIREIEDQLRTAKLKNDVQRLTQILDESYVEVNQNGNTRTKARNDRLVANLPDPVAGD